MVEYKPFHILKIRMEKKNNRKRQLKGEVISSSMQNTVRVRVDTLQSHPVYKKVVNRRKIFFAHTNKELNVGDQVVIRESRPYSKNIKWIVVNNNK